MTEDRKPDTKTLPDSVLFVCNFNAVRSPMAEAIAKYHCGNKIYIDSFGVGEKLAKVNPFAVSVMEEVGVDISGHQAQDYDDLIDTSFDLIIALSPQAHKKAIELTENNATDVEYWPVEDPTKIQGNRESIMSAFRELRDDLYNKIKTRLSC
jgi:protein-tyrosine-phosphatase|tara:strand:- start:22925 stop:23380 length:456 start_codon:yes stop_codon:yes gene_type:complete